ncbi:hypothetical protein F0L68_06775 [Solihabitans fulvus]|uniref:Uncharacterized protein n=1 Tax=Solihabitans fulvus TaxID=1892852 RepID=A0A5B2XPJ1_9PSEU|nr:hypothetical protein [Solihabitans fulvus]KAA2264782.1 hypothetical protein F0L68_06775 [Solihabitans fulvus]
MTRDRGGRPVELVIAAALLVGFGLFGAFAGIALMAAGPMAALSTVGGCLVALLAWCAWLGSSLARGTLLVILVIGAALLLTQHRFWPVGVLAAGGLTFVASPRVRAWYD